jgi:hypothetical protein
VLIALDRDAGIRGGWLGLVGGHARTSLVMEPRAVLDPGSSNLPSTIRPNQFLPRASRPIHRGDGGNASAAGMVAEPGFLLLSERPA